MREFVGVKPQLALSAGSLKRDLLIFSRIAVTHSKSKLKRLRDKGEPRSVNESYESSLYWANELEWLIDKGIIFDPELVSQKIILEDTSYIEAFETEEKHQEQLLGQAQELFAELQKFEEVGTKEHAIDEREFYSRLNALHKELSVGDELVTRRISIQLRLMNNLDAYPILTTIPNVSSTKPVKKSDVIQIVFNALPIPDESVSWEQIHEYLSDPDTKTKFLALRSWMADVARGQLDHSEIEDKLEYLISQYEQHIKLHKLKSQVGAVETIVVGTAEILEDVVRLKWGEIAKRLFSFKHRRIELLEGERTAPGSEVAYIVKARNQFS